MSDYGTVDRLLHHLSLAHPSVGEVAFALDQMFFSADPVEAGHHVYVAGLARAGTTVLMRRIHDSGEFRSLTYADMPFVLAPNLWRSIRQSRSKVVHSGPRAHGDGIIVNSESPESFEEVFWRTFAGASFIAPSHLSPHDPDHDLIDKYRSFVASVLRTGHTSRYLCKNNNNILRLSTIRSAFPNATILIPYRNPIDQASSLLRQHLRFKSLQQADSFTDSYMKWLVHHEFGGDHRAFAVGRESAYATDTLAYWVDQWLAVYGWLQKTAPKDALWVRYESLCEKPQYWDLLAQKLEIQHDNGLTEFNRPPPRKRDHAMDLPDGLLKIAEAQYQDLPHLV
ncbi:sulfotransferase [Ruegeria arenilitoris]|uniref:sulfotransferase n=1 Tax=Ruegeria arenilitoris TaxID=1173585 RepID=UPI00147EE1C1|nr:sulfotransferase [Ruegeria arenilitoris]